MKIIRCREMGFDCEQEIRAENEEEALRQVAEHAQKAHGVQVTPEMAALVHIQDLSDTELEQIVGGDGPTVNAGNQQIGGFFNLSPDGSNDPR